MNAKFVIAIVVCTMLPAASRAQVIVDANPRFSGAGFGLNTRAVQQARFRDMDPFFGNSFDERFPEYGRSIPRNVFRHAGHDFLDFDGTPGSIDRDLDGIPDVVDSVISFGGNPGFDPFDDLTPAEIRSRGDFLHNQARGVGARAYGIGTGSGNQAAGFGAYNYGTTAGLGLMYSGMGDYYAGQGQFLRGAGDYEHANSLANINNEEAEYRDIKNDDFYTTTYFNKRRTNLQARSQEDDLRRYLYSDRPSAEELARLQKLRAPDPLGPREYDPLIGMLSWPTVLQQEQFDEERQRISKLFAERSEMGRRAGLGSDNYREVRETAQQIRAELREKMDELTPMEYVAAKRFIDSVEHEARGTVQLSWPVAESRSVSYTK